MLYDMLSRAAGESPDRPAIFVGERAIAYRELRAWVDACATKLSDAGVGGADGLVLPNCPEFVIAVFAAAKLGAVVIPLNPAYQERELSYYFRDCNPRAIVTTPALGDKCGAILSASASPAPVFTSVPNPEPSSPTGTGPPPLRAASAVALYQYSSGSTGTPKRVPRTHGNLVAEADNFVATVGITRRDRILTSVPLFHAHGFGNCLLAAVRAKASMILLESFSRQAILDALIHKQATIFPGVPFMFEVLAASPSIKSLRFPSLRLAFSAGAPLRRETYDKFREKFDVGVRQLYGSTEAGSVSINRGYVAEQTWDSVGLPMKNVEIAIVDAAGRPCLNGEIGEVLIKSPAMTAGYSGLAEINREKFRDGYFWTGDLGQSDAAGNLYLRGRTTLFINAGGLKVDPVELEDVLRANPGVQEAVVLGIPGPHGQDIIKAVIVPRCTCSEREIQDWCRERLAPFKVPRIVEFRSEIPKSPVGKILRKYLQDAL